MEEESSNKMKLGGHVELLETMLGVRFTSNHVGGMIPTSVYHVKWDFFKHSLPIGFKLT